MSKSKPKTPHGGKRSGAGRVPIHGETMDRYTVRLTKEQVEIAKNLGGEMRDLAAGIRAALDAAKK